MIVSYILLCLLCIEWIYSFFKKDKLYTFKSTVANVLTGIGIAVRGYFLPVIGIASCVLFIRKYRFFDEDILQPSLLSFVICFLLIDFVYYVFHRASHRFQALWMIHFPHHSDTTLNLGTGFRGSWFETPFRFLFYAPLILIGLPLRSLIDVLFISTLYEFLKHSRYIPSPKYIDYIFVTPAFHAVHHDKNIHLQSSNFGGVLSIWDRLFKTYSKNIANVHPGIEGYERYNIFMIQLDPFVLFFKKVFK